MTQHAVVFFCGSTSSLEADTSYIDLLGNIKNTRSLYAYYYDQTEDQAQKFVDSFKVTASLTPKDEPFQINIVAHDKGAVSALAVVKLLQADPELRDRVQVTLDLRDPIPGNTEFAAKIGGNLVNANRYSDLSNCPIVKKVYISLQELPPFDTMGNEAFVPKFHPATSVEIESIPGHVDTRYKDTIDLTVETPDLLKLGQLKTKAILVESGQELVEATDYKKEQIKAYDDVAVWVEGRNSALQTRNTHQGGKLTINPKALYQTGRVLNWRHAKLVNDVELEFIPHHIMLGATHPNYDQHKNLFELACDFSQAVDAAEKPVPAGWLEDIRTAMDIYFESLATKSSPSEEFLSHWRFYDTCQKALVMAPEDKEVVKALQRLCTPYFFFNLSSQIEEVRPKSTKLYHDLLNLQSCLLDEFNQDIAAGKSFDELQASKAVTLANHTANFIAAIQNGGFDISTMIKMTKNYANSNIKLGHNWHIGSKIIVGAIISLCSTVLSCIVTGGMEFGLGLALASAASAPVAILAGTIALLTSAALGACIGLSIGVAASCHFFKPSVRDTRVQTLAEEVAEVVTEDEENDEEDTEIEMEEPTSP